MNRNKQVLRVHKCKMNIKYEGEVNINRESSVTNKVIRYNITLMFILGISVELEEKLKAK